MYVLPTARVRGGSDSKKGAKKMNAQEGKMKRGKRKKYKLNRKVWMEPEMVQSSVFMSLSKSAMWVLLRFLQKITWSEVRQGRRKVRVYKTTGLVFTYAEAKAFGISESTFWRAIKRLVEKGFLDIEHQGGAYGPDYSRYKLSDRWKKYGTPEFKVVEKRRVLPPGLDAHARKEAKRKLTKPKLIISRN